MKYVWLLPLLLIGCAKQAQYGTIDQELQQYQDLFLAECELRRGGCGNVHYINLVFMDQDIAGIAGRCYHDQGGSIHLNRKVYNSLSPVGREILVMHEYGHCFLKQSHRQGSIMSDVMMTDTLYTMNREHFLTELFQ